MNKRNIIGLIGSLSVFFYALNMNYNLWKNGDEIWWFGVIMQFVFMGMAYAVYRVCNMKTFQEQYRERFPNDNMEKQ